MISFTQPTRTLVDAKFSFVPPNGDPRSGSIRLQLEREHKLLKESDPNVFTRFKIKYAGDRWIKEDLEEDIERLLNNFGNLEFRTKELIPLFVKGDEVKTSDEVYEDAKKWLSSLPPEQEATLDKLLQHNTMDRFWTQMSICKDWIEDNGGERYYWYMIVTDFEEPKETPSITRTEHALIASNLLELARE